jgi:hypothetical protein
LACAICNQLLYVIGWEIGTRDNDEPGRCNQRYRVERRAGVVAQRLVHHGGDDLARGHDAERVAVVRRARDGLVAERAGGARPIFHHYRRSELLLQRVCNDAPDDVGAAAGSE